MEDRCGPLHKPVGSRTGGIGGRYVSWLPVGRWVEVARRTGCQAKLGSEGRRLQQPEKEEDDTHKVRCQHMTHEPG